jgi:exopolysaccharide production protein ExoZ
MYRKRGDLDAVEAAESATAAVSPKPKRAAPYQTLDAWRGLAALAVVMLHWSEVARYRNAALGENLFYQVIHFGGLGVQLFFVISGYVIAATAAANVERGQGLGAYLWARGRRIYPTYWAAFALMLAFGMGGAQLVKRGLIQGNIFTQFDILHMAPQFLITNLTLTMLPFGYQPYLIVSWTLAYEVAFYAIVGLSLLLASRSRSERLFLNALHILTCVSLVLLMIVPDRLPFPFDMWPQFGLGVMVFDVLAATSRGRASQIWLGAGLALSILYALLRDVSLGYLQQPGRLSYIVAVVFALVLVYAYRWDNRLAQMRVMRWFGWLGLFSYSLYLTHFMTVRVAGMILQRVGLPDSLHAVAFVIAVSFAVGCAYVFFLLFEKPLIKSRKKPAPDGNPDVKATAVPTPTVTRSTTVATSGEPVV